MNSHDSFPGDSPGGSRNGSGRGGSPGDGDGFDPGSQGQFRQVQPVPKKFVMKPDLKLYIYNSLITKAYYVIFESPSALYDAF